MLYESLNLTVGNHEVILETFVHEDMSSPRDAVLIFPGGGYSMVCHDREGAPIARAYFEYGLNAFVLHYKVGEGFTYPSQLIDASYAMCYIKRNAEKFGISKDRIFTVGFSAGGHLSGSMAILHNDPEVLATLGISEGDNKPCGSVLCYPVVSALVPTHTPSFEMLTGKAFCDVTDEEKQRLSLECNVNETSAPAFIWHTSEDDLVPMVGSLRLTEAYYDIQRPVALRIYPYGIHGLALSNEITVCDNPGWAEPLAEEWLGASVKWMETIK